MKKLIIISVILFAAFHCNAQDKESITPTEHVYNLTQNHEIDEIRIITPALNQVYVGVAWEISFGDNLLSFKRYSDGLIHQWNLDKLVFIKMDPKDDKVNIVIHVAE